VHKHSFSTSVEFFDRFVSFEMRGEKRKVCYTSAFYDEKQINPARLEFLIQGSLKRKTSENAGQKIACTFCLR